VNQAHAAGPAHQIGSVDKMEKQTIGITTGVE
jgi:hypothetical protein